MTIIETERMVIKTNLIISNGNLVFPNESSGEIDVYHCKERITEDGGFGCYDKNDQNKKICHIGLESKTYPLELSYGIEKEEDYKKGYMREAVHLCIFWLFNNTNINSIFACPNGDDSKKVLEYTGFEQFEIINCKGATWYKLSRDKYFCSNVEENSQIKTESTTCY